MFGSYSKCLGVTVNVRELESRCLGVRVDVWEFRVDVWE